MLQEKFMAAISHSTEFLEGQEAWGDGVPRERCPYTTDGLAKILWLGGWDNAERHEQEGDPS